MGWGGGNYDGVPITFANGTIIAGGSLVIVGNNTTDITIQSDYVFDTTMWDIIGTAAGIGDCDQVRNV